MKKSEIKSTIMAALFKSKRRKLTEEAELTPDKMDARIRELKEELGISEMSDEELLKAFFNSGKLPGE